TSTSSINAAGTYSASIPNPTRCHAGTSPRARIRSVAGSDTEAPVWTFVLVDRLLQELPHARAPPRRVTRQTTSTAAAPSASQLRKRLTERHWAIAGGAGQGDRGA